MQTSLEKVDLAVDSASIVLNSTNFDFGMFLEYTFRGEDSKVQDDLDIYVDLSATLNTFTWFYNTTSKEY